MPACSVRMPCVENVWGWTNKGWLSVGAWCCRPRKHVDAVNSRPGPNLRPRRRRYQLQLLQHLSTSTARNRDSSSPAERSGYGSTDFINITLYADHSDRLKYSSLPVDQGWRNGA